MAEKNAVLLKAKALKDGSPQKSPVKSEGGLDPLPAPKPKRSCSVLDKLVKKMEGDTTLVQDRALGHKFMGLFFFYHGE